MLAAELMAPSDITRAFADALVRPGKGVADFIKLDEEAKIDRNMKYLAVYRENQACCGLAKEGYLDEIERSPTGKYEDFKSEMIHD